MTSDFLIPPSLGVIGDTEPAKELLSRIWGKKGVFTCTVGSTYTSAIPGVSEAGDTPELTMLTGPADGELISIGHTICIEGVPVNPGNIPTPGVLTMAALNLSGMERHIINGGCKVTPGIPFYDVGAKPSGSIVNGRAVPNAREIFEKGKVLGEILTRGHDFVVVSESIAGGTTTALATMMAIGTLKENLVSSSSPKNPKEFKTNLVEKALKTAEIEKGDCIDDPLKAVECVGDAMIAINAGIVIGASKHVPVIVGGGTQMSAVLSVAINIDRSIEGNVVHGTTRWLVNDPNSDIGKIMKGISDKIPLIYVNIDYSKSPYDGLKKYEEGFIKEGVGCGGASIAAIAMSSGKLTCDRILDEVHRLYRKILKIE